MIRYLAFGLFLGACGGGDDSSSGHPDACFPARRDGTYLVHTETVSGSCGDIGDTLVRIEGAGIPGNCVLLAPDVMSDGDCTLERVIRCEQEGGVITTTTAITTMRDAEGNRISGTVTLSLSGAASCTGTYSVTYTRQ